jgi:hypothetical protein
MPYGIAAAPIALMIGAGRSVHQQPERKVPKPMSYRDLSTAGTLASKRVGEAVKRAP